VWTALVVLSIDSLREAQQRARARARPVLCDEVYGPQNV
jgi:hypothetical protein